MKLFFTVPFMLIGVQLAQAGIVECKNSKYKVNLVLSDDYISCSIRFSKPGNAVYDLGRPQVNGSSIQCEGVTYARYPYSQATMTVSEGKGQLKFQSGAPINLVCRDL